MWYAAHTAHRNTRHTHLTPLKTSQAPLVASSTFGCSSHAAFHHHTALAAALMPLTLDIEQLETIPALFVASSILSCLPHAEFHYHAALAAVLMPLMVGNSC